MFDHSAYNLSRYHRVRSGLIARLGGKCSECGAIEQLEMDHKDREDKSFDISKLVTYGEKRLKIELDKCQLLCRPCHLRKSILERGFRIAKDTHGTLSSYRYCKCDLCRTAKSEWSAKKYREKKAGLAQSGRASDL